MPRIYYFSLIVALTMPVLLSCVVRDEEDEENIITVTIAVQLQLFVCTDGAGGQYRSGDQFCTEPYTVIVEMGKSGAIYCEEEITFAGSRMCFCEVDLYKDQRAEVKAYLNSSTDYVGNYALLNWETLMANIGSGKKDYYWNPTVPICVEGTE